MRTLKIVLYILLIVVLQTVVFSRLNLWGVSPDLFLVSIIGYAVIEEKQWRILLFSLGTSLIQGMLARGVLLNVIFKVVTGFLAGKLKESFAFDKLFMILCFVALFTPLTIFLEGMCHIIFWKRQLNLVQLLFTMLITTIYNLIIAPLLYPLIRRVNHG